MSYRDLSNFNLDDLFYLYDPATFSNADKSAARPVHNTFQVKPDPTIGTRQQPAQQSHYKVGGNTSLARPAAGPQARPHAEITPVSITSSLQNITHTNSPMHIASLHSLGSPVTLRLVKLSDQGVWHSHAGSDEVFIVFRGAINVLYRTGDGTETIARIVGGELLRVPMGMEHLVDAEKGTEVLLLEGNESIPERAVLRYNPSSTALGPYHARTPLLHFD
jgi:mannose-6-phosphate isomerase-like protein (cupin superfamily)